MPDASLASGSQQAQCSPCHWHQGQGLNLRVRRFHTPICNAAVEDWYATSCFQNDQCLCDWIGLYTSPHLVAVRERIRINGKPIAEEAFARYFFEVWDRLEKNDVVGRFCLFVYGTEPEQFTQRKYESTPSKPMYFKMVTLVAFHAFMDLKVVSL